MDDRSGPPWLLGILGLAAVLYLPLARTGEQSVATKPTAPAVTNAAASAPQVDSEGCQLPSWISDSERAPTYLIATVPDPIDSALDYAFDGVVDVILQTVEATDSYVRDRHWLPWEHVKSNADCHRLLPGVVEFRRTDGDPNQPPRLLLLLVGESPIMGVQNRALVEAAKRASAYGRILVLGPTLSGSIPSLGDALCDPTLGPHEVSIVSGSALSPKNADYLKEKLKGCPDVHYWYRTTVLPIDVLQQRFYRYLREHHGVDCNSRKLSGVALLREASTLYGAAAGQTKPDCAPEYEVVFPAHLSRLRSEFARRGEGASLAELGKPPVARKILELSLGEEKEEPADVVRALSSKTPPLVGLQLQHAVANICDHGARFVGLVATDLSDRLFLAQQVSEQCPNVRLFTFEEDIAYAHSDFARSLEGTLLVTQNPLRWRTKTQPSQLREFADSSHVGIYNAVMLLLGHPERLLYGRISGESGESGTPGVWVETVSRGAFWPINWLDDRGWTPPAYFYRIGDPTPVGAGQRLPSQTQSPRWRPAPPLDIGGTTELPRRTQTATVIFGFLLGAALLVTGPYLTAVWRGRTASLHWACAWSVRAREASTLSRLARLGATLCVFGAFVSLLVVYVFGSYVTLTLQLSDSVLRQLPNSAPRPVAALMIAVLAVMIFLAGPALVTVAVDLVCGDRVRRRFGSKRRSVIAKWVFFISLGFVVVGFALGIGFLPAHKPFLQRTGEFTNGVSIALPLAALCLAVFLICGSQARRLAWLESAKVRFPFTTPGFASLVARTAAVLRYGGSRLWLVVGGVTTGLILLRTHGSISSLEGPTCDAAFSVCIVALLLVIAHWIGWFFVGSAAMGAILKPLACLPLGDAFKRLPERFSRKIGSQIFAGSPRVCELEIPARELLHALDRHPKKCACDLEPALAAALHVRDLVSVQPGRREAYFSRAQERLSEAAASLAQWVLAYASGLRPKHAHDVRFRESVENVVAIQTVLYLFYVQSHLRSLLVATTSGLLLLLVAVGGYPFQPQRTLVSCVSALVIVNVTVAFVVFVRMERSQVLSEIAKTSVGQVSWDRTFLWRLIVYVMLPLIGVVLVQFPVLSDTLSHWLAPMAKTLP